MFIISTNNKIVYIFSKGNVDTQKTFFKIRN